MNLPQIFNIDKAQYAILTLFLSPTVPQNSYKTFRESFLNAPFDLGMFYTPR